MPGEDGVPRWEEVYGTSLGFAMALVQNISQRKPWASRKFGYIQTKFRTIWH